MKATRATDVARECSREKGKDRGIRGQSPDMVACLGSNDLDGLRADCRGNDNLVAGDRDDLVGAAAI
jgi:hypothetical protein